MSESKCITQKDKFESLENLIKEYYCLVQKINAGLPPYARFKEYLVDEEPCCINRPEKVRELVNKLDSTNADDKLKAILQLLSHGGEMYISDSSSIKSPKIIHSVSNTARLQVFLENGKQDTNGVIIDKDTLLKFAEQVGTYIKSFNTNDILEDNPITHKLKDKPEFKQLIKNNIDSVINEILFWYYYKADKYPIINSRAKNSRQILKQVFSGIFENDLEFNKECMDIKEFNHIKIDEKIYISKQLMLDQLFLIIDAMKNMKEVVEIYKSNPSDEIYLFYKKLWNSIKEAKRIIMKEELNLFKNIIYHGAPGTGKTYELKKEIKEYLDFYEGGKSEFIQFHSSYYYEDFIGGLKPNSKAANGLSLEFKNGIFKELCREAARFEVAYYTSDNWEDDTKTEITFTIDGRKYTIDKENPDFSSFPPYFILIDEINRADLSKVFGELLFAIEDDYRGFENRFKLSTSQMENNDTAVYWDTTENAAYFFVPENLYIRGTMNDIDRSVDSIDFAFRRRFKWIEKKYNKDILEKMLLDYNNVQDYLQSATNLNKKIVKDISMADESYKIGHAIFRNIIKYAKSFKNITKENKRKLFDNHIEPIVYNYLKMDYGNASSDIEEFKKEFVD
jgi:5-methylcytosine-specific restriction protein B